MKKAFVVSLASMCIVLSGCSSVRDSLEEKILVNMREKSNISSDASFVQFQEYTAQGEVVDGYYAPGGKSVTIIDDSRCEIQSGIQISFASNSHLDVHYFYDSDFTTQIDAEGCILAPGSSIYAKVKIDSSVATNKYEFSSFRIYEYDTAGQRSCISEVPLRDDGLLWHIPEDFEGNDIVIEPFGKYENRTLSFQDYCYDTTSNRTELDFTWMVDDKSTDGDLLEINPMHPYSVCYKYDNNQYFFVSSVPVCYSYNDNDGTVYFKKVEPNEDITAFSVELKKYMTAEIQVDAAATYSYGDEETNLKKNETYKAEHLKYGDKIIIKAENPCKITYDKELFSLYTDNDNHRYTLTVREGSGDFVFDPNAYSFEHGDIVFTYAGHIIDNRTSLAKGRQIHYYAQNVDDGYWLPDGDHIVVVGDDSETKATISKIQFFPKQKVIVNLPQPACGGSITYSINGVNQEENSVTTYCGTTIQMNLNAWNGWRVRYDVDTVSYMASIGQTSQTATINGSDVNHAFEELPTHKPTLIVSLEKSVGTSMMFDIATASGKTADLTYGKGSITGKCKIYESTIGTPQGITIKAYRDEIQDGKVLKIVVDMTDAQKNKTREMYYIECLPDEVCIPIYQVNEIANSQTYYKSIEVTISVVNKRIYQPAAAPNAVVTLTAMDVKNQPKIDAGDILDDERTVRVVIKPNNGYYVTGSKVKFDQYQNEMSFGTYLKGAQSIINKHPVKKIYTVILDCSDEFGTVEYTIDGTSVKGDVNLREEQKLVMKYQINVPGYQISRVAKGFVGLYNKTLASKTNESVTIEISSALDGHTIRRSDYIQVETEG